MKKVWILISCFFLIFKGYIFSQSNYIFNDSNSSKAVLTNEINESYLVYINLLEEHQNAQNELIKNSDYYNKIRNNSYVLSGEDLNRLNRSFSDRIDLLDRSLAFPYKDLKNIGSSEFYNLVSIHLKIKAIETFVIQQRILGKNIKVQALINEGNLFYRNERNSLKRIKRILNSNRFRKSLQTDWDYFCQKPNNSIDSIKTSVVIENIAQTSYYQNILSKPKSSINSKKYLKSSIKKDNSSSSSVNVSYFMNNFLSKFSNLVGNLLGVCAVRKGKLHNNKAFINTSLNNLEPLDVLLEKTPFRLTDKFIPGYWGHAAIYIGNETQLKELKIWNHPFIKQYHKEIKRGKVIVEALRSNVAINTFKKFTNIDDFVHLRLINEPMLDKKREMIVKVFAQIGKKYDFGYNVESNKRIICSELHYIVFDQIKFETNKFLGISSISVDEIATQGFKGGAFYPISLYLDGVKVEEDKIFEIYDQLPKAKKSEIKKIKKGLN